MKRILFLVLTLCVFIFTFSACSGKAETETQPTETTVPQEKEYTLVIDADNFDETFSEGAFYDELDSIKGITYSKNETANEYTLRMTESAYKTLREKKAEPVYSSYEDLISNEENYV
ncbi:MAG: hypothetical protein IKC01_05130, partial [Clostridia bacterium]|nr:hypothetical protein [Clostridia bacterium]